jgi:predicted ester cyclase
LKDPSNEKFSKINLTNNAYITRVGNIIGGNVMLKEAGFVEEDGFLAMKNGDMARIADFVANIERVLATRG